jgi:hypothetical protein
MRLDFVFLFAQSPMFLFFGFWCQRLRQSGRYPRDLGDPASLMRYLLAVYPAIRSCYVGSLRLNCRTTNVFASGSTTRIECFVVERVVFRILVFAQIQPNVLQEMGVSLGH